MFKILLMMLILTTAILFSMSLNPLFMSMLIVCQTLLTCLLMNIFLQSFWFSYIFFLVFIGGMLVLFIYIISLINKEKFYLNYTYMKFLLLIITLMIMYKITPPMFLHMKHFESNITIMNNSKTAISQPIMSLFNFPTNLLNLMMVLYLLMLMVVVVKITNFHYGPIRMKIYIDI